MAEAVPLGIQHVLAMFAGNITIPLLVAQAAGPEYVAVLVQIALLAIPFGMVDGKKAAGSWTSSPGEYPHGWVPLEVPTHGSVGIIAAVSPAPPSNTVR